MQAYLEYLPPKPRWLFLVWATFSYKHLFIREFRILRYVTMLVETVLSKTVGKDSSADPISPAYLAPYPQLSKCQRKRGE